MSLPLTRSQPTKIRRRPPLAAIAAALAAAAAVAFVMLVLAPAPPHVRQLTVENPTAYPVKVDLDVRGGHLDLVTLGPGDEATVKEVLDPGDEFVFRFSSGDVAAGETRLERSQLAGDGWRLSVPSVVEDRVRDAGLVPPPQG